MRDKIDAGPSGAHGEITLHIPIPFQSAPAEFALILLFFRVNGTMKNGQTPSGIFRELESIEVFGGEKKSGK